MSLRTRIYMTLAPLLVLLAIIGGGGVALLYQLGGRVNAILRENYDSVHYMEQLKEALERIDSSFTFALAGREDKARLQYAPSWKSLRENLDKELNNITIPGEGKLADQLAALARQYRDHGDSFYARPAEVAATTIGVASAPSGALAAAPLATAALSLRRQEDYFGTDGLLTSFVAIKNTADEILHLNQNNMEQASEEAKRTARRSTLVLVAGLALATMLALMLSWRLVRDILDPLTAVTEAAKAIGAGHLDRTVPVSSHDEIGQFAQAFNVMTQQLRALRRTNLQRLVRAQQTSQAAIDSFPDPIVVVDRDGGVELANPPAQLIFGVASPGEGRTAATPWLPPEPLRNPLEIALKEQRATLTDSFDQVVFFRLQGDDRSFLPQVRPIRSVDGETLGAVVVLTDVTRFRLLDQLKTDLVATASHELMTPLSGLRLALHLLLEERVGTLTPKQTELLLDARDNAERLLNLIEHLLALARLEHGAEPLALKAVDPFALLQSAADIVAARAQDKRISLRVEGDGVLPPVAADAVRVGYALNNLLDNALTYTEPGGKVTLSAEALGADNVRLTVADTGVGIPPQFVPHVFDKFFRVPDTTHPPGTGLGLAIVREIALAHGGLVTCESEPGKGTVFHLTLPAWKGNGHERQH